MHWTANSTGDLAHIAAEILTALGARRKIALVGEMGAGKTTFVRAFCSVLGVTEATSSPTFSIINQYAYHDSEGKVRLVHHLDLYRLKQVQEALDIGIEELLEDDTYCLIEWPQLIEALLPPELAVIQISVKADDTRQIVLSFW